MGLLVNFRPVGDPRILMDFVLRCSEKLCFLNNKFCFLVFFSANAVQQCHSVILSNRNQRSLILLK